MPTTQNPSDNNNHDCRHSHNQDNHNHSRNHNPTADSTMRAGTNAPVPSPGLATRDSLYSTVSSASGAPTPSTPTFSFTSSPPASPNSATEYFPGPQRRGGHGHAGAAPGSPTSASSSPTETSFFSSIAAKVRARSRSRSRNRVARSRSRSPLPPPPAAPHADAATAPRAAPAKLDRSASSCSSGSDGYRRLSDGDEYEGPSDFQLTERARRTMSSGSDFYYGRHANQWLFNGFSVRDNVKKVIHHHRHSHHDRDE